MAVKRWTPIFLVSLLLITVSVIADGCSDDAGVFPAEIPQWSQPSAAGMGGVVSTVNPSPGSSNGSVSVTTPIPIPTPEATMTLDPDPEPVVSPAEQPVPRDLSGPLRADFTADSTDVDGPTRVEFSDLSVGNITNWQWDLNGDGTIDSADQNPSFYFESNGDYTVTLTVSGPDGEGTLTRFDYIHVSGCGG